VDLIDRKQGIHGARAEAVEIERHNLKAQTDGICRSEFGSSHTPGYALVPFLAAFEIRPIRIAVVTNAEL